MKLQHSSTYTTTPQFDVTDDANNDAKQTLPLCHSAM